MLTLLETMPINNCVLSNGIRLITEPIVATKAVAIGFWFSSGSRDEGEGEFGITHYAEHLLFKGSDSQSAFDIARFFDRIGGYVNAFTEREMVCVHCCIPGMYTEEALEVLIHMIWNASFHENDIEVERSVIISEILASQDDPDEMGMDRAISLIYPGNAYSRPIAGTEADIMSLSAEKLREFYELRFKNIRPLVSIAGNFNSITAKAKISRISFDRTDNSPLPENNKLLWQPGVFFPRSVFKQSQVYLSYPMTGGRTSRDWFSWAIINAIIGDTVSSRLNQSLRERKGLCYSVFSFFVFNRDSAFWMAATNVPPEKTYETVDTLLSEIDEIRKINFNRREFDEAKTHLIGELLLSEEDTENRMKRLARQFFLNGSVFDIDGFIQTLNEIGFNEVNLLLKDSLIDTKRSLVLYTGKKESREMEKKWKSNFLPKRAL